MNLNTNFEFTDENIKLINDTIDKLGLNGDKKMSEVLEELDQKYNISGKKESPE